MTSSSRGNPCVRLWKELPIPGSGHDAGKGISIVLLPGFGTTGIERWGIEREIQEHSQHFSACSHVRLLWFDFEPSFSDQFSWRTILDYGHDLLQALSDYKQHSPDHLNSTIFICHSLGGTLLKQAFRAAAQQPHNFGSIIKGAQAFVFLSCPHRVEDDDPADTLNRYNRILKSFNKLPARSKHQTNSDAEEAQVLIDNAIGFESLCSQTPVFSLYDGLAMRTFRIGKAPKLVDEAFAKTHAHLETLLKIELPHGEMCQLGTLGQKGCNFWSLLAPVLVPHAGICEQVQTASGSTVSVDSNQSLIQPETERYDGEAIQLKSPVASSNPKSRAIPIRSLTIDSSASKVNAKGDNLPCFMVAWHERNPDFYDRVAARAEIHARLFPSNARDPTKPQYCAICGMGGIGKTDLAVQYVYEFENSFSAVFWVDAASSSQLLTDFAKIAITLGIEDPAHPDDLITNQKAAISWLASWREHVDDPIRSKPWLLVFDNADDVGLLAEYWPTRGFGCVIVTSRDPLAKSVSSFGIAGVDLEPFTNEEGSELVRLLTTSDGSKAEIEASAVMNTLLDGLPLGIVQMAGIIRRREWSIQDFVEKFRGDQQYRTYRTMDNPIQRRRYGNTLATAWQFDDLDKDTTKLLKVLALLNPDRIQEQMFLKYINEARDPKLLESDEAFDEARSVLLSSSIIRRNKMRRELWIHRVPQHEIRSQTPADLLYELFGLAVCIVANSWPGHSGNMGARHKISRWKSCEEYFPHLQYLHVIHTGYTEQWKSLKPNEQFANLMEEAASYLHERGLSYDGNQYALTALAVCERIHPSESPEDLLMDTRYILGAIANETNDWAGITRHNPIFLQMAEDSCRENGRPTVRLAVAHNQMGCAYMVQHQYDEAVKSFSRAIEIVRGQGDAFDVDLLGFPLANLGSAYWLQGRYSTADEVYENALREREKAFGTMDTVSYKTGRLMHGGGNVKMSMAQEFLAKGDDAEASRHFDLSFQLHRKAFSFFESTLGPHHHRTADASHSLATHSFRLNAYQDALKHIEYALQIWGDRSWYRNEVARTTFLKGKVLAAMGPESDEASKQCLTKVYAMRRDLSSKLHYSVADDDFEELVHFWSR